MERSEFESRAKEITRRSFSSLKRLLDSLEFSLPADASETLSIETSVRSLVQSAQELLQLISDLKMYLTLHDFKAMLEERATSGSEVGKHKALEALQRYFSALQAGQDFRFYSQPLD